MYKIMINGKKYELIKDYCEETGIYEEDFNEPVKILDGVTDCSAMFRSCTKFNQPVIIPDGVTDCSFMFAENCRFDQPITIPDSVTNCRSMFMNCHKLNKPVSISNNAEICCYMFYGCSKFNQPVNIPNSATNCERMFYGCSKFNQPVNIPNSVKDCSKMFAKCYNFDQEIIIPANCLAESILLDCPLYTKNIKFKNPVKISSFGTKEGRNRKFYIKMNNKIFISTDDTIVYKNIKILKNDIVEYNPVSQLLIYKNKLSDKRIYNIMINHDIIKYYTINNKTYEVNIPHIDELFDLTDEDEIELNIMSNHEYELIIKNNVDDTRLAKFLLNVI